MIIGSDQVSPIYIYIYIHRLSSLACFIGYTHTSADEMYHTVWETVEGSKTIPSPVAGHVFSIVDNVEQEEVDEDTVLVEVSCDEASLREAAGEWVEQDEYENRLHRQSPGKFDDSL